MALSEEEIAYVLDLFAGLGPLTTRKMMGGLCLYHDGTIFAILRSDGELLLKGAGDFIPKLRQLGAQQWTYTRDNGKSAAMPYWSLPDAARDDPEAAVALAREALAQL